MRILFLTASYPLWAGEGRGVFVHELARRLAARGHEVTVVAARLSPASLREEVMDGVRVVRVPLLAGEVFNFEELTLRDPRTLPVLLSYVVGTVREALRLRARFDLIHAQWDIPCGVPAVLLRRLLGIPLVVTLRGLSVNWPRTHPLLVWISRWILRGSRRVMAISPAVLREAEVLGFAPPRLGLVERGVDTALFSPASPAPGFAERAGLAGGRVVLFVGDLTVRKGVADLLEAFGLLARQMEDLTLVLVGDGPLMDGLRRRAARMGLEERVHIAGRVPPARLVDYYRLCSVFVLPSLVEAMGTSAVEAMACGRPTVVTAAAGEAGELLRSGAAVVAEPGRPESLADAIRRALADGERLGRRGREYALGRHSWGREVETVLRAYREALEEDGGRLRARTKIWVWRR